MNSDVRVAASGGAPGSMEQSGSKARARRRLGIALFLVFFLLLVPAAILAYLWYAIPPRVPTAPVHLVRSGAGRLEPREPAEQGSRLWYEFQAGKIQSRDTFSASSSLSRSDNASFACSRLVVFNRSDHLLMARVGQQLLERLKPLEYLRQVDYYPAGFQTEPGDLSPDLTVTFELVRLVERPGLRSSDVEATVLVSCGNAPPGCRHSYWDHRTPPLVQLDWHGRLEHSSTTTGLSRSRREPPCRRASWGWTSRPTSSPRPPTAACTRSRSAWSKRPLPRLHPCFNWPIPEPRGGTSAPGAKEACTPPGRSREWAKSGSP